MSLHLRGVVLPEGERRDLWIDGEAIADQPLSDAETVCEDGWIMPGLVDAHCHIGLGVGGRVDAETARAQALADRAAGVLLIRDAGSPSDTRWIDGEAALPRIVRAGRHIARPKRYLRHLAVEIEPEQLPDQAGVEAAKGDGWVKLVGDWIDRGVGDLAPLWPAGLAAQAIERAHRAGARVTAHCFAEESVQTLVRAGIDCIEHGTGLDADTIALMAERGTALVPTMINLELFPVYAEPAKEKFPVYAAHMADLHARRRETIGLAREAGVPVYAGTDAGTVIKHGRLPDELAELAGVGGAEFALGAGSWRAREWLGADSRLVPGAAADLVVYAEDPRRDMAVLAHPKLVVLRGRPL
ncbi:MAG: amidohydrolase family protein [Propionibacteriaceae bacterium]|jgi:imidazolonepropionase-like amidohydrolase|nr:amidohydrolase family protein [Propionibacteriaceae bacterium]